MIKLKEKNTDKPKGGKIPYYELVFDYMIGDANGDTTETITTSVDNPHVERFVKLINSLKPLNGTWGIVFCEYEVEGFSEQLELEDYQFLNAALFGIHGREDLDDNPYFAEGFEDNYLCEFEDGVRGETEYSFLVFQGVDLYYYDEYGVKNETEITS